ncbi:hypothetical protein E4U19_004186 [Claviceps sp. Clav32 group G5]|nr:hypothetical protein E4U19_004186 [Claviceps sp. Clav32 group G5]KAG6047511.1 hypothetical protein E4U39_000365 [Claviceps sp. Clav50 group G5]
MAATALEWQQLDLIFESRPDIIEGIKKAADSPGRVALFNEIAHYIYDQIHLNDAPASKRRKVDAPKPASGNAGDEPVLLRVNEISVSIPVRKKLELCFTENYIYAQAPGTLGTLTSYSWQDIGMILTLLATFRVGVVAKVLIVATEYIFYLPVPGKTQIQFNYIIIPKGTSLPSKAEPTGIEPLVFTVPATAPKEGILGGSEATAAAAVSDTFKSLFHWAFQRRLRAARNPIDIVSADPNKFHSTVRQVQRPNEKAVHVSGFRGSKDGYLFFLDNGILWGFKKPLIFIPRNRIAAISYTNILQITFNMVVEVFSKDDEPNEEFEFGMLDQQDYGSINDFVQRNGLQDRSMAEQRKAKLQLAENRASKKGSDGAEPDDDGAANDDNQTELEKAQLEAEQQLQDDEDEDEEDYDPGSDGGDSDGSGESSEDDDGSEQDGDHDDHNDDDDDDDDHDDDDDQGDENGVKGEDIEQGEEEEEQPPAEASTEPMPPPTTKPAKPFKAEPTRQKTSQVPLRQGWAALRNTRPSGDVDMEEHFDVV